MTTPPFRPGDRITVRDEFGKQWPARYVGEVGKIDSRGVLFEINGQQSRTELVNIKKA